MDMDSVDKSPPHILPENSSINPNLVEDNVEPPSKRSKPPRAPSKSRKESVAWDHFDKVNEKDAITGHDVLIGARCKYCPQYYAAGSKSHGTSNMLSHLKRCAKNPCFGDEKGQQTLELHVKSGVGVELVATTYTYDACKRALAEMIIIDEMPFRIVEGQGFKRFCSVLQPKFYPIPSRTTITREVTAIYTKEKEMLKQAMKGRRICLTTDTWTSIQNLCYMCLTAHYINDNWKVQKKIISFCLVDDHKGETVGRKVEMCLLDWGVDCFFTLTVDNAASNSGTIKFLKEATSDWKGTILEHEFLHMRCCAHILNLVVGDALKEKSSSITSIRHAVRFVRSSPNRHDIFDKYVDICKVESKSGLCLDVPTRWNSTYKMLEGAIKYEAVFERMKRDDESYKSYFKDTDDDAATGTPKARIMPSRVDWDNCRKFVQFLGLFYTATLKFSGSLYVTSNTFFDEMFVIKSEIQRLIAVQDPLLSSMAVSMLAKFDKYWGSPEKINLLLYVAVVLDPRRKISYLKFCLKKLSNETMATHVTNKVSNALSRLFNQYGSSYVSLNMSASETSHASDEIDVDLSDPLARLNSEFNNYLEETDTSNEASELEKYLLDELVRVPKRGKWDILDWWKANSSKYKVLSQVARDVLAMPVSTVASESAFSTGGRILDPFRSSLAPSTVQILVCTQNWLRSGMRINLRESMDEVEEFEEDTSTPPSESSTCSSPNPASSVIDV